MIAFALYLLKVSACSGLLYAYYYLALRNRVFHQYNRFYLIATVAASLLFPFLTLPIPVTQSDYATVSNWQYLFAANQPTVAANQVMVWSSYTTLALVYLLVSVVLMVTTILGIRKIWRLAAEGNTLLYQGVKIYFTSNAMAPFSFFNRLFWRKDIALETLEGAAIFRHEMAHIKAYHSMDKLLLQLVLVVCWVNPFFWIIRRELQLIHEFVADKDAAHDSDAQALARMILQTVYGNKYPFLINPFFQQPIKRRLTMLHKTLQNPRNAYIGRLLALPVAALTLLLVAQKTAIASGKKPVSQQLVSMYNLADTLPVRDTANIKEMHVDATNDSVHRITITYKDGRKVTYDETQKRHLKKHDETLVVIDGQTVGTMAEIGDLDKKLKPADIASVHVWKGDEGEKRYGEKGKAGVIEITTLAKSKEPHIDASQVPNRSAKSGGATVQIKPKDDAGQALLVIDGKEMGRMGDYKAGNYPFKEDQVESMNVLKDKPAIDKYGEKGKYGVIEITMKKQ